MFTIVAQTPTMARTLEILFALEDQTRAKLVKAAQAAANGARFVVIDAGFPALRYLVWDCERGDNLRGAELNAKNPPRHPWFVRSTTAQKIADKLNAAL